MTERLDLRRFARTALLATTLAACGGGQTAPKSPDITPAPTQTPASTEIILPTPTPTQVVVETPTPTETPELSLEQQATNAVIDTWINLLNTTQKNDKNISKFYLQTSIANFDEWKHNIDLLKYSGTTDSDLTVNWIGGEILPNNSIPANVTGYEAIKSEGQMLLQGINSYTESDTISNTDKAKGYSFMGKVVIQFNWAPAENRYYPPTQNPYVPLERVTDWILKPETDSFLPPSLQEDYTFVIPVDIQNGKINVYKNYFNDRNESGDDIIKNVTQPLPLLGDPRLCDPNYSHPCQQFTANY